MGNSSFNHSQYSICFDIGLAALQIASDDYSQVFFSIDVGLFILQLLAIRVSPAYLPRCITLHFPTLNNICHSSEPSYQVIQVSLYKADIIFWFWITDSAENFSVVGKDPILNAIIYHEQ